MERRLLLRATSLLVALAFTGELAGCGQSRPNQQAVISPHSQVWRPAAVVHAGNNEPLPEPTNNNAVSLAAGGMVTTNSQVEAKVVIADCLTLFILQNGNLKRSTCRKSDSTSGLGVCSTAGMVDVINDCLSQIDIQTPSSSTVSGSTWFSVIYLPQEQRSLVQVYEGQVSVSAAIDLRAGEWEQDPTVTRGNLWFTAPGETASEINGITGRTAQSLGTWLDLRPKLIEKYPQLETWMESARLKTLEGMPGLIKPAFPTLPPTGQLDVQFGGALWQDKRVQRAFVIGVDWTGLVQKAWPDYNVTTRLLTPAEDVRDARKLKANPDLAARLLAEAKFPTGSSAIVILSRETDAAALFAKSLQETLSGNFNIRTTLSSVTDEEFARLRKGPVFRTVYILLESSGDALIWARSNNGGLS